MTARATSLRGRASEPVWPGPLALATGVLADGSAHRANEVVVSPAGIVVAGALNPGGRFSSRTSMAPSKPSSRSAVTLMGSAPPFHTAGLVGLKLTMKLGRGGRIVKQ